MRRAGLVVATVLVLAGCGGTRTVTIDKTQPPIRNRDSQATVLAHFAGRPAEQRDGGGGYTCRRYMQDTNRAHPTVGSWVLVVCFKGSPES